MYKHPDLKGSYNPLNDESDDILGLYENELDTPLSEGSVHDSDDFEPSHSDGSRIKSERSERESVAWFKRPVNAEAIPESMNFDEVESIMWRKVKYMSDSAFQTSLLFSNSLISLYCHLVVSTASTAAFFSEPRPLVDCWPPQHRLQVDPGGAHRAVGGHIGGLCAVCDGIIDRLSLSPCHQSH
jgi:hypothetical protein